MPTRIVLKNTSFPSKVALVTPTSNNEVQQQHRQQQQQPEHLSRGHEGGATNNNYQEQPRQHFSLDSVVPSTPPQIRPVTPPRSVMGYRSSFLREFAQGPNVSNGDEHKGHGEQNDGTTRWNSNNVFIEMNKIRLSKEDIRASPRLTGYLFTMISAAVLLVSVVQFYNTECKPQEDKENSTSSNVLATVSGRYVYRWKLWGAIYASATGVGLSIFTVFVHFETVCMPSSWNLIFRDGSLSERNWIWFLMLFWATSVHVCTSTLSIGQVQANVFFTTWISFGSACLNYIVWRESAGLSGFVSSPRQPLLLPADFIDSNSTSTVMEPPNTTSSTVSANQSIATNPTSLSRDASTSKLSSFRRETTYNWIWTGFFSFVLATSSLDVFFNRKNIPLWTGSDPGQSDETWYGILAIVWAEACVCVLAVVLNECLPTNKDPFSFSLFRSPRNRGVMLVFGWRQLEGLIIVSAAILKFWVILEHTGVDGIIHGLSNSYFGVWGSFFNSVFTFGRWLHENKNIEYVIRGQNPSSLQ